MTLRLTTLLALCAALQSTLATGHAWVSFLVPKQWKDTASVRGKNSMDGEMITMTRAENDPQSQEVCANLVDDWGTGDITTCGSYYGLTAIGFSEPTKNPRPINVTLGDDIYHVSQNRHL